MPHPSGCWVVNVLSPSVTSSQPHRVGARGGRRGEQFADLLAELTARVARVDRLNERWRQDLEPCAGDVGRTFPPIQRDRDLERQ
jgi:hypothetical protein